MGPEVVAAIVAPFFASVVSIALWQSKKHYEFITENFSRLTTTTNVIEQKIDDLRFDVAKNYVTNEDLARHIEEDNHLEERISSQLHEFRDDLGYISKEFMEIRIKIDKISHDL